MSDKPDPDDGRPVQPPGNGNTHSPLPYYVRLRCAAGDDAAVTFHEYRGWAYSLTEALSQAIFEAGGIELDGAKVKCEEVRPDLAAYADVFESPMFRRVASAVARKVGA